MRIGLPLDGWDLAVVDADLNEVAPGVQGELIIGGVGLARYLDPEKDAEKYAPMPSLGWERAYRSGDVVVHDPEGLLFAGRADDQIKIGGRRIELGEIDSALLGLTGVVGAAAAVRRTAAGNQLLVGYVTVDDRFDSADGDGEAAQRHARPDGAAAGDGRRDPHPHVRQGRPRRAPVAPPRRPRHLPWAGGLDGTAAWMAELLARGSRGDGAPAGRTTSSTSVGQPDRRADGLPAPGEVPRGGGR